MKSTIDQGNWRGVGAGVLLAVVTVLPISAQTSAPATNAVPAKKSPWEATAAFGAIVTRGNSETMLFNLNVGGSRKRDKNEIRLGLDGTYGEQTTESNGKSDTTINNEQIKGFGQYNRIFGEADRWFGYIRGDASHDGIAGVEGRFSINPGVGYYFIKNDKMSLNGEAGPGFTEEKLGDDNWHGYYTFRAAERFEYKINERSKLWQTIEWLPQVDDPGDYRLNAEVGITTAITPKWDLRLVFQDTYTSEPAPGRKENDLKLVAGVQFKFL